tara:strand:+ start:103 stop:228 length:126 start_codon:yes stop_codon:yes gene_type:complete
VAKLPKKSKRNPVAKYARKFNKSKIFRDKKKYSRKDEIKQK